MRWNRQLNWLMFALAVTCALGLIFKLHCMPGGWTASEQYTTGCYSDAVPFWGQRGVAAGEIPYFEARLEYPVLTGALIWIEGGITRLLPWGAADDSGFLVVVTLVNALLAALVLWLMWREGVSARRLWAWALSPMIILYLGHNWDMLAVAFAVWAVLLARRGRLARGAAAAGLGGAAKLFPVLLLPLIGLQALGEEGADWRTRIRRCALAAVAAIGAWGLVNLPVALFATTNWLEFYTFSRERSGTAASVWEILSTLGFWAVGTPERNLLSALALLVGGAAIVTLGWRRHRARLWLLFTPLTAWFLLVNKVYSPQFDLWLFPLAVMTAPRLLPVALYAVAGAAAYFAEFWWFAAMDGAWPAATPADIALAAAVRGGAMLWIIADSVLLPAPAWVGEPEQASG